MKTDLSSQITLTRIPQRYYRPENAFEHSVLTRLEKIPTNIYESADEGSFAIAVRICVLFFLPSHGITVFSGIFFDSAFVPL